MYIKNRSDNATNIIAVGYPDVYEFQTYSLMNLNDQQKWAGHEVIRQLESFLELEFTFSRHGIADLRMKSLSHEKLKASGYGYYPPVSLALVSDHDAQNPHLANFGFFLFLHEVGHALGLGHPHEFEVPNKFDSFEYSIMSYNSYSEQPGAGYNVEFHGYPQTFMTHDIYALQEMYGANYEHLSKNTHYYWDYTGALWIDGKRSFDGVGNNIYMTVWDGGGEDTYDFSFYEENNLLINLAPGQGSITTEEQLSIAVNGKRAAASIYNAFLFKEDERSIIENAIGGGGDDVVRGNQAANGLWGGGGNDLLVGLEGADHLVGGRGADRLKGGTGSDRLQGGSGRDKLAGGGGADTLVGGSDSDKVSGGAQADVLSGGKGKDVMAGGAGDDWLKGGKGSDRLMGGAGDDWLKGGKGSDRLKGGAGDDWLKGGEGSDWLKGGGGRDQLLGDNGRDALYGQSGADILSGGGGRDRIYGGGGNDLIVFVSGEPASQSFDRAWGQGGSDAFEFRWVTSEKGPLQKMADAHLMDFVVGEDTLVFSGRGLTLARLEHAGQHCDDEPSGTLFSFKDETGKSVGTVMVRGVDLTEEDFLIDNKMDFVSGSDALWA